MNATSPTAAAGLRNGAAWVAHALEAEGVDTIFGYPGGAIMPFYDALVDSGLKHVLVRHEQGAALAANGYARASGKVGVCVATSGPGASNLVTGIADGLLDSVPMVCITGQVATPLLGTDAFQELDVFGMTLPIVKHSFLVRKVDDLPHVLAEAFRLAREGRPGPVLIDLPKDVQVGSAAHLPAHVPAEVAREPAPADAALAEAIAAIACAEKPVVYGGGGIALGEAVEEFRQFVEATRIPTVLTLRGLGALPGNHPHFLGMLGMHGTRAANIAVQESDLLVVVGARFDDRATGKLAEFAPHARIIHFDIDPSEIGKLRAATVGVAGDLNPNLEALNHRLSQGPAIDVSEWADRWRARGAETGFRYDAPGETVFAPALLKELSELAGPKFIAACDVGQHQMWVAQHCAFSRPQGHITSGGLGSMGFGLPAGIGAKLAEPDAVVVTISGDGGIMMNIQELATVNRFKIPLKILLLDNSRLGMVRQWQEFFFERNFSEVDLSDNPDFVKVAEAFGIPAFRIDSREQVSAGIDRLLAAEGPILAHVIIDPNDNVWPLVPPGKNNAEMLEGSR